MSCKLFTIWQCKPQFNLILSHILTVRLHASIAEEGYHYLVFDL